jgi:hypothetical protein
MPLHTHCPPRHTTSRRASTHHTTLSCAPLLAQLSHLHPGGALQSSTVTLPDAQATTAGQDFWLKHRSNVMIVKESAKFCLKEKIPAGRQVYKVKGTMTLTINSDKRIRRIELLHSFDTSMHR